LSAPSDPLAANRGPILLMGGEGREGDGKVRKGRGRGERREGEGKGGERK